MSLEKEYRIENEIGYFPSLDKLGIPNFFTYSNSRWGHMGLKNPKSKAKYQHIFEHLNINPECFIYIGSSHNNEVQLLDQNNLDIYKIFNKSEDNENAIVVGTDALITKLRKIPIVITPADCAIICITGLDEKKERFISIIHAGIYGTMLDIHLKTLEQIRYYFNPSDLKAFIYPSVSKKYYRKALNDDYRGHLVNLAEWKNFLEVTETDFGIDIEGKIISDLNKNGLSEIFFTGLDTFNENERGNLHSLTYYKSKNQEKSNFAVGLYLK